VRYLLHPPFAMERLRYDPAAGTVACHTAKMAPDENGRFDSTTVYSARDWLLLAASFAVSTDSPRQRGLISSPLITNLHPFCSASSPNPRKFAGAYHRAKPLPKQFPIYY
jgi:hypothetical protein